jgi:hypothetical protein
VGQARESLGQEEVLNMLSTRFEGDKRTRFERAVRNVERISENAAALKNLPTDQVTDQSCEREKGKKALELAAETINILREIITEKYANEIPGLYSRIEARSMGIAYSVPRAQLFLVTISANTMRRARVFFA